MRADAKLPAFTSPQHNLEGRDCCKMCTQPCPHHLLRALKSTPKIQPACTKYDFVLFVNGDSATRLSQLTRRHPATPRVLTTLQRATKHHYLHCRELASSNRRISACSSFCLACARELSSLNAATTSPRPTAPPSEQASSTLSHDKRPSSSSSVSGGGGVRSVGGDRRGGGGDCRSDGGNRSGGDRSGGDRSGGGGESNGEGVGVRTLAAGARVAMDDGLGGIHASGHSQRSESEHPPSAAACNEKGRH